MRSLLPVIAAAVLVPVPGGRAAAQPGCTIPPGYAVVIGTEPLEMVPGERRTLPLGISQAPYLPLEPLPRACRVRWSTPPGSHMAVDSAGRLHVTRYVKVGDQTTVTADVAGRKVFQEVHVIDPHPNPIAGTWTQSGPAQCAGAAAAEPVRELVIRRDGRFSATFVPFESYKDYWGVYTYDRASGALDMHAVGGNRVPPGLDLAGTARVANGRLTLRDVWLGQPGAGAAHACTYVFVR